MDATVDLRRAAFTVIAVASTAAVAPVRRIGGERAARHRKRQARGATFCPSIWTVMDVIASPTLDGNAFRCKILSRVQRTGW